MMSVRTKGGTPSGMPGRPLSLATLYASFTIVSSGAAASSTLQGAAPSSSSSSVMA